MLPVDSPADVGKLWLIGIQNASQTPQRRSRPQKIEARLARKPPPLGRVDWVQTCLMWRVVFPLHKSSHSGDEMSLPARITAEPPAGGGCQVWSFWGSFTPHSSPWTHQSETITTLLPALHLRCLEVRKQKIELKKLFTIYSLSTQNIAFIVCGLWQKTWHFTYRF